MALVSECGTRNIVRLVLCCGRNDEREINVAEKSHRPLIPFLAAVAIVISLAFIDAKDGDGYGREQSLITAGVEKMEKRGAYYGVYNVSLFTTVGVSVHAPK